MRRGCTQRALSALRSRAARRATLIDGDVSSLEWPDASVTRARALAVSSAMFWPDQPRAFSALSLVLAPGGMLALEVLDSSSAARWSHLRRARG